MNCFKSGYFLLVLLLAGLLSSCSETETPLPILGNRDVVNGDTIYPTIPDFEFINQDSQLVTNATFAGKVYVVDFFFISCPSICPGVTKQMLKVHDHFLKDDRVLLMAHTIDTKHDTIPRLKAYAENLGANPEKWHFVTGPKDEIFDIADDYFSVAVENPDSPGGFDHSGRLILVDKNRHVRAFCDGTDPEEVTRFMTDIDVLLKEQFPEK